MNRLIALRATGLLADFEAAGVLAPADVHVAQRLGAFLGETDERVLLAAALTVRGTRLGSVVLDLADAAESITADSESAELDPDTDTPAEPVELAWPEPDGWVAACRASPLVTGTGGGPPLQMVGTRLWLDRYWRQEVQVAHDLRRLSDDRPRDIDATALEGDLAALFTAPEDDDQRRAVAVAALSRVSVIAGGPGTGKTTTVAQLIAVLRRRLGASARIALAAPTGKAAARLAEAIHDEKRNLTADDRAALAQLSASTLHRLLGWRPESRSRFKHDRGNHLPFDVVIVDESSMVSLTLMARLLEALAPTTRLVLVGDPDQLASVEAGAVLGDLVAADAELTRSVAHLTTLRRQTAGGSIAVLAGLVRAGRADDALAMLREQHEGLEFHEVPDDEAVTGVALAAVERAVVGHERGLIAAAEAGDVDAALDALDEHRVLCAHRAGPRGVAHWTLLAERWVGADASGRSDGRYPGEPLLITANDYEAEVYNGDTGVVVEVGGQLQVALRRGGGPTVLPLVRLGAVRPLHAMTVHRAQGSQFTTVTVLLPSADSPLATRQTFYTAITRAVRGVRLIGSAESVLASVARPIARATGLRARLAGELVPVSAGG